MKDVCVYDDTYDLIMSIQLDSRNTSNLQASFAMRLYCLIEDFALLLESDNDEKK